MNSDEYQEMQINADEYSWNYFKQLKMVKIKFAWENYMSFIMFVGNWE